MRIFDLFETGTLEQLKADLNNLLLNLSSSGLYELDTRKIVSHLNDMGHGLSPQSIMPILNDNPIVGSSTEEKIILKSEMSDEVVSTNDEDKVEKMAIDAAKKGIQ
jgi:carbamoylphosphate synthase small subunit